MSWQNILKETNLGGTYLAVDESKELTTENLNISLELKEVSGDYKRRPSSLGDDVGDKDAPTYSYTEYGEYQYAFLPKITGYAELYDGDTLVKKFKAEDIGVSFEGGSFKNIKTFPVPIVFEIELDYDDNTPFIYITMQVA